MRRDSVLGSLTAALSPVFGRIGPAAYAALLLALALGALVYGLGQVWNFTIDDAGISYAYAKHLADGDGPVAVIGGPRIEGYSNPLWVFLLVPVRWLGLPIPEAAKLLGASLFALTLAAGGGSVLWVEGRRWWSIGSASACFAIVSSLCLELVVWAPAGLENTLFSALLLGMIGLDLRESENPQAFPASGLCAFALSITRPEAVAYAAPLLLIQLVTALKDPRHRRQALTAALLFIVPLALYHTAHYLVFGEVVPNTYYAKPGTRPWRAGFDYLTATARDSGLIYVLPLALVGLYQRPRLKLWLAAATLAGCLFVLYSGGDWMPHGRFVSLFAPAVLVLGTLGLLHVARLLVWLSRGRIPRELAALGLGAAVVVLWSRFQVPRLNALRQRNWCHFCERVADTQAIQRLAARARLPSHSLVTQDFGGPSWLSDESFYPIDFLGLCDRSVVLIRGNRASGGVRNEFRFYQYLIHEQPLAPSWILVPPNFWPGFDRSIEYRSDYFALNPRSLPRARRDSFFVLHRGELADYFPPLPSAPIQPLTDSLVVQGFGVFTDTNRAEGAGPAPARLEAGAHVLVVVSLVPRGKLLGTEQVSLVLGAGERRVVTEPERLDRGLDDIAGQFQPGEPLGIEFAMTVPMTSSTEPTTTYRWSLELSHAKAPKAARGRTPPAPLRATLGELPAGSLLGPLVRSLPRYPSALPAPIYPELRALRPAVTLAVEQSRRQGRAAPADTALSVQLEKLGDTLEREGQTDQAYLANVWATQVDRRAWERLASSVHRLRQTATNDEHATEISLLRRSYASGTATDLARLVAFYLSTQRQLEADFFLSRWRPTPEDDPRASSLLGAWATAPAGTAAADTNVGRDALADVAIDPLGGALDFESSSLDSWSGESSTFRSGPTLGERLLSGLRGQHGSGSLCSTAAGEPGRGELSSPEFRLDGQVLSLLVAGGTAAQKVGVELLVDAQVVRTASGNDSDNLLPVFWDIVPFQGKSARLRVFDRSARQHVCIDRVLLWR